MFAERRVVCRGTARFFSPMPTGLNNNRRRHSLLQVKKYEELATGHWGLDACPPARKCAICKVYGEDLFQRRQLRNLYLTGIPVRTVSYLFDPDGRFTSKQILDHAARHAWHYKRSQVQEMEINESHIARMLLLRAEQARDVVAGNTYEKSIELLMRLKGFDRQKIEMDTDVHVAWERLITTRPNGKKATITLPDQDFGAAPLPALTDQHGEED